MVLNIFTSCVRYERMETERIRRQVEDLRDMMSGGGGGGDGGGGRGVRDRLGRVSPPPPPKQVHSSS